MPEKQVLLNLLSYRNILEKTTRYNELKLVNNDILQLIRKIYSTYDSTERNNLYA